MASFFELAPIFIEESTCITFLFEKEIFYNEFACQSCGQPTTVSVNSGRFRCNRRSCRKEVSIRIHSFFYGHSLKCSRIMHLAYLWLNKVPVSSAVAMSGHSSKTICDFWKYFRQLVTSNIDEEDVIIGGPGIVVEIDESKFGKRKYHRGHRVEGVWIFGGVERTPERKIFAVKVEDRSMNTLVPIIQRHVRPGSIIHSDLWRAYHNLEQLGYEHLTVNHSVNFKDPETGACTNAIEGSWNGIKASIPPRNRVQCQMEEHLFEFIWRRKNKNNIWDGFISALRDVYYD